MRSDAESMQRFDALAGFWYAMSSKAGFQKMSPRRRVVAVEEALVPPGLFFANVSTMYWLILVSGVDI